MSGSRGVGTGQGRMQRLCFCCRLSSTLTFSSTATLQAEPMQSPPFRRWFRAQGLAPAARPAMPRNASLPLLKLQSGPAQPQSQQRMADVACATPRASADPSNAELLRLSSASGCMLVMDFDKTLVDWDAGAHHSCAHCVRSTAPRC